MDIGKVFGPQFLNGINQLNKTDKLAQPDNINFKTNPQVTYNKLNPDTLVGLKQFAMTGITPQMANDVLADVQTEFLA